jgi:hypothetical protein
MPVYPVMVTSAQRDQVREPVVDFVIICTAHPFRETVMHVSRIIQAAEAAISVTFKDNYPRLRPPGAIHWYASYAEADPMMAWWGE